MSNRDVFSTMDIREWSETVSYVYGSGSETKIECIPAKRKGGYPAAKASSSKNTAPHNMQRGYLANVRAVL